MKKYDEMILGDGIRISTDCSKTQRNNNVIVCGSSGSGKTMSFIEPKLLCTKNSSLIVTMSKRRLVEQYAGMFRERGYQIMDLNFADPMHSLAGYDPLQYLRSWMDVSFLAQAIVMSESKKLSSNADPYWDMCAVSLLSAVMAAAMVMACHATMADAVELFGMLRIMESSDGIITTTLDHVFDMIREMDPIHYAVSCWDSFRQLPIKTASCVYSSLSTVLDKLFPRELCMMMKRGRTIDLEKLSSERTVLFVTTSAVNPSLNLLINIFYSQMFKELFEIGERSENGRLSVPVQVVCDDFACGAKILHFEEYISIFREKGISVMMMLQSESQLRAIYGDYAAQTIINNADTYVYMGGMDLGTAKEISSRADRSLEEILCLPVGKLLIFRRGEKYVMTERYRITEDKEYQRVLRRKQRAESGLRRTEACEKSADITVR